MNFNKLKLRTKLIFGFAAVTIIAMVIGLTSYNSINSISQNSDEIANVSLPSIKSLLVISEAQTTLDASENALLATGLSSSGREEQYNRMAEALKRVSDAWKIYEPLPQSKEEAVTWKEFVPAWNEYIKMHEQYVTIAKKYESDATPENYNEMSDFGLKTISPYFSKAESLLNRIVEINEEVARDNMASADQAQSTAQITLIALIIIGIILSSFFAILITRNIMNDVGGEPAEVAYIAQEVANGNLTLDFRKEQGLKGIYGAVVNMTEKLKEIITNVVEGTDNIASASEQMSSTSQQLSQGANESASSVEEVSSTMEEMTSNIEQNNQNAAHTEKISVTAYEGMREISNQTIQAVDANRTISEKIKIINDIAFQTNILALNAAVEAARAGEQGRGFAVVAAEVRKLAERSKVAADEIVSLSVKSLKMAEGVGRKMEDIMPELEKTTKMVQEISAASAEQTNGALQINNAIQQMNTVTQQNASASEELSGSAEELSSQAEQLRDIVSYFRIEDGRTATHVKKVEKKKKIEIKHIQNTKNNKSSRTTEGFELSLKDNDDSAYGRF